MSFCVNCGSKVSKGDTFCGSCGKKIEQIEDGSSNNSTHSINAQKDYNSAKTIGSSTARGNLTYLRDFNYEPAGIISISYIDGIVSAEDKISQTKVHGSIHEGHGRISSTVVNKQYIHIQTANGKEINLTASEHIHLRVGNHVRLYYACKKGTKPEDISMPNFLKNMDSDLFTDLTAPDFIQKWSGTSLMIIVIAFILAIPTAVASLVVLYVWIRYKAIQYDKKLEHFTQLVRTEINHVD